jgi:hypothetical protein
MRLVQGCAQNLAVLAGGSQRVAFGLQRGHARRLRSELHRRSPLSASSIRQACLLSSSSSCASRAAFSM